VTTLNDTTQALTLTVPRTEIEDAILTEDALTFLTALVKEFAPRRDALLDARAAHQAAFDAGETPDFFAETADIRNDDWTIAGIPDDLQNRQLEITGPCDRKMIINALNADVDVFMVDFEDATAPTWENMIEGQWHLRDANRGAMTYTNPGNGKVYELSDDPAMLIARPRGIHLPEKHLQFQGQPIPGALMDFALYFYHNYQARMQRGSGVYYYIPKLEHYQEAQWWDDIFRFTEEWFQVPVGTIKATILIETLPAVFQMHEMLYVMRDHIVAMNCGRWDYIFSYIKTLRNHPDRVLPDRQQVTMDQPFLDAYSRLLIRTCHSRGAMAMGGMAAFIPSKDPEENKQVLAKVDADKDREARNGHDGTWIAHPGLASTARGAFKRHIPKGQPNQLSVTREDDAPITAEQLIAPSEGTRTEAGMRSNIRVSLQYLEAWLQGNGCVPIYGLMEDAATAEISRTSIWQWIRHGKDLDNGETVTADLFKRMLNEEAEVVKEEVGATRWQQGAFDEAVKLMSEITTSDQLTEFLTLPAYDRL